MHDRPKPTTTPYAILARRSARQQRLAILAGDRELAAIFALTTAMLLDQHLAACGTAVSA